MRRPRRKSSQRMIVPMTAQDAALYDANVVPRYSSLFGRLLVSEIPEGQRLQVLDLGCGTGYPALEILKRLGETGRVIAIDQDAGLIDVARRRALGDAGRRIFFKTETAEELSFGDEVFDLVVGNLALGSFTRPDEALSEIRRVLVTGGRVMLTHALEGTFEEVIDMFREVALKRDDKDLATRVERIVARYPPASTIEAILRGAGFESIEVKTEEFQLTFGGASEIFSDPTVRFIALPEWRWIAGFEADSSQILEQVQRSLDTYFGGGPLSLRIHAGVVIARA